MSHKLSTYRVFAAVFLFLNAGSINTGLEPMGKATWLGCLASAVIAAIIVPLMVKVCRGGIEQNRGVRGAASVMLAAAVLSGGVLLGQFRIFVTTYNELVPSPSLVVLVVGAAALYLSCLRGHGLWRYCEAAFAAVIFLLAVSLFIGIHEIDTMRLLPLWQGEGGRGIADVLKVYGSFFADIFAVLYVLAGSSDDRELIAGARWGIAADGLVMALFRVKCIGIIGYVTARRYAFPVYALSGLQRIGSYGIHIEDVITCALAVARIVKLAVIIKFCTSCFEAVSGRKHAKQLLNTAAATLIVLFAVFVIGSDIVMDLWLNRVWIFETAAFVVLPFGAYHWIKRNGRA
ncbi:MAG: hypothetical protein IIW34_05640 [Clostridia bacterium]|nr:hypothetical protein [Clostridia bacterium]MBQ5813615.1 hypothetical protein [Clostridia bacterium]